MIVLFILVLSVTSTVGQCPGGWHAFGERCFMVSDTEASWAGAMATCQQTREGHLANIDNMDVQLFIANLVKSSNKILHNVSLHTNDDYHYHYLHDLGIDVTQHTSIVFNVRACNDAHIALSQAKGLDTSNTYEIVIGGWTDSQSVIRDCKQCAHQDTARHSSHPLDCKVAHPFWISWSNNYIRVGSGNSVGEHQFMSWNDTDPHAINYVAIATGFGSNGDWTLHMDTYMPGKFWVGAADLSAENEWLWLPSQAPVDEYSNWAVGEPNNALGYQHCMTMDMHSDMAWNDDICEENRNFVCEVAIGDAGAVIG